MRYDVENGFFVQVLFEIEAWGIDDVMSVIDEGNSNRRVASYLLDKDSSRSHAILGIHLHSEWNDPEDGHIVKKFGKVTRFKWCELVRTPFEVSSTRKSNLVPKQ